MIGRNVAVRYIDATPNSPWCNETREANLENGTDYQIAVRDPVFWMEPIETAGQPGKADRVTGIMTNNGFLFAGIAAEAINPGEKGSVVTHGRVSVRIEDPLLITYGCGLTYNIETGKFARGSVPSGQIDISEPVVALEDGASGDTTLWAFVRQA